MKKKAVIEALESIRSKHPRKLLQPRAIVNAARSATSPLHKYFEWNNGKAAEAWRIQQARQLIVRVEIIREDNNQPVQAYFSLPSDRGKGKGGGYHGMMNILSDGALRTEMLNSAIVDLERFQERYNRLHELTELFKVIKKVKSRVKVRKAA